MTAGEEDLSDNDVDYRFSISVDSAGALGDHPAPAPLNLLPLSGSTTNTFTPVLSWSQNLSGTGYDVTSFLLELNNSSSLDGTVLWRVNTFINSFRIPFNLTGAASYYWRVWARNRKGILTQSTQAWSFYIDSEEPFANTPRDKGNRDNFGRQSGDEDADES